MENCEEVVGHERWTVLVCNGVKNFRPFYGVGWGKTERGYCGKGQRFF